MNRTTRRFILIAASLQQRASAAASHDRQRGDRRPAQRRTGAVGQSFGGATGRSWRRTRRAAGVTIAGDYRSAPRRPATDLLLRAAAGSLSPPQVVYSAPPVYYQRYENNWNDRPPAPAAPTHDDRHRGHDRSYDYRC
jgi:hypothetical protein